MRSYEQTSNLIRKPPLYPAELRGRAMKSSLYRFWAVGFQFFLIGDPRMPAILEDAYWKTRLGEIDATRRVHRAQWRA